MSAVRKYKNRLEKVQSEIVRLQNKPLWDTQEEHLDKLYEEKKDLEQMLKGF